MSAGTPPPRITRHRFEIRWRDTRVVATRRLTPAMVRVTLAGDLDGFHSPGFDDHVKLQFGAGDDPDLRREFTPRRFDPARGLLEIDFALHDHGPASDWAAAARPGDALRLGGPRGSREIAGPIAHWLMIGDETALPAIARFLGEARPGLPVTALIAVRDAGEEQPLDSAADLTLQWLHRATPADPAPLLAAVPAALPRRSFVWIAAEAGVAQAVRARLEAAGHPADWLMAKGYWRA